MLLLRHLDREQVHQFVAAPSEGEVLCQAKALGLPSIILPAPPVVGWRFWSPAAATLRIFRFLRRRPVSLVHAHGSRGALYAGIACRLLAIPLVWHVRIAAADPHLDRLLARLASQVVAISDAVATRFAGLSTRRPVVVIPNAVDEAPFADPATGEAFRRTHRLEGRPLIAMVARLSPEKGQEILLNALPRIVAAHPDVAVLFAGAGSSAYQAALAAMAEALGVGSRCLWLGRLGSVAPVLHAADLVVLPSTVLPGWAEGFGRVLVEAALCGKPAVATRSGGIPEVVRDGETGLLVPPGDAEALAEALSALLTDTDRRRRLGQAAQKHTRERFGVEVHCRRVAELYVELMSATARSGGSEAPR